MWHSLALVQSGFEHGQHRGVGGGDPGKVGLHLTTFSLVLMWRVLTKGFADGVTSLSCHNILQCVLSDHIVANPVC